MPSNFYLAFTKIFVLASWINLIPGFIAYFINESALTFWSIALAFTCAALAIIFYIIYRKVSNREDLEIIKEIDKQLNGKKDK